MEVVGETLMDGAMTVGGDFVFNCKREELSFQSSMLGTEVPLKTVAKKVSFTL